MQLQPGDEPYVTAEGALKTPTSMLFILLFLMRGYAAWVVSLTFAQDRGRLLQFFYTTTEQFGIALLVGLPALFALIMVSQVKQVAPVWVRRGMRWLPILLGVGLLGDGWLLASLISAIWPTFSVVKGALVFGWFAAAWMLLFSRHLKRYRQLVMQGEG